MTLPSGTVHMPMGSAIKKNRVAKRMRLVVGGDWVDTEFIGRRERVKINLEPALFVKHGGVL